MKFQILSAHDEHAPGPGFTFPEAENAMEEIYFEKLKKFQIKKKVSQKPYYPFEKNKYFITINTLEDLLELIREVDNPIIITPEGEIWIYDGWIE